MSEKDIKIIEYLMKDARMPYTEIARRLGVTEAAVRKRVKKLEEEGIIRGYRAIIDAKRVGYKIVAEIGFDVEPEQYVRAIEQVKQMPEVKRMKSTTGDHMILLECWFHDSDEMVDFVRRLESIPGVQRVCPAILVEEIK
ncbi:MAG: Lrp/AsnC family transcriptional regulator [Candidatus Diapherotrites archaeon]|nr:Lrp/AsnC family transcriptional regulator [Candidatus Diapherotrites archaeon]